MANNQSRNPERHLYLVQHGEAKSKEEDPERPLTARGRDAVEQVASWAALIGLEVDQIRHSGKRRAEETAQIFNEYLKVPDGVISVPGIAPNDDVQPIAAALEKETHSLMLVGHLPFLSRLASQLLTRDSERTIIRFSMGGLVWLVRDEEQWSVRCMVPPELVP
ncbi:MAG: phosphohistidine phosphatase SixA [bacterium]